MKKKNDTLENRALELKKNRFLSCSATLQYRFFL